MTTNCAETCWSSCIELQSPKRNSKKKKKMAKGERKNTKGKRKESKGRKKDLLGFTINKWLLVLSTT